MRNAFSRLAASRVVSRLAIGGMLLAILALGALAVWANMVAQGHARDLSHAAVQTSGHLRASQALSQIDKTADILEEGIEPQGLAQLRTAQLVLDESLRRMQRESFVDWERRLAVQAEPEVETKLDPAIEAFLAAVRAQDEDAQVVAEEELETVVDRVQLRFNDMRHDPSQSLTEETAAAAAGNAAIDRAAIVLIPFALLFVGLCAWLLNMSRRRADAERERMEAELRLSQRLEAVGHLAAGVAHEINTPMQFIGDSVRFVSASFDGLRELGREYKEIGLGLAGDDDAIRERFADAERRADLAYLEERLPAAFSRTLDGVERVATIVTAMKDFSRPNQVEQTPADLNAAIASSLVVSQNEHKYVADVETEFGELPPVLCNISELNQVFLNLIVNAAHAIGADAAERGSIRITTGRENGHALITVSDSGPGIPDEIRERIFDPFFTTKDVGKGTGQGLAIASTIVDRHGGSLTLESTRPTTFAIRLPIV
jgi:signal transduction histidine kinase